MIDPSADRPIYRQIADELRDRILSRQYAPGSPLPTEAALIHEFGAGKNSVRDALSVLESEHRIVRRRGLPATVREEPELTLVKVMRGSTVWMDPPTPDEVREYQLAPGVKMFVVADPSGKPKRLPGDRHMLGFS